MKTYGVFIAPTFICGNPFNACMVRCEGQCLKVLLWIMEEFFHISHSLTDMDHDGRVVLCYELMIEAEHHFRIKRGSGTGRCCPSSSTGNTFPCPPDKLEDVAWNRPDSKTLECLVWSVYDGILSPGPTPKLTGPESYNQVTRRLTSKVFRGCKCAVRHVHRPNLMNQSRSRCTQLSLLYPQAGCQKSRRLPRSWTRLPIKSMLQERELWEERRRRTQIHIQWHGCAIAKTLIVMK